MTFRAGFPVRLFQAALYLCALAWAPGGHALEVIVHPGVITHSIERARLQNIFGLRIDKWPDNQAIRVFVLPDDAPAHGEFVKRVLGIYPYQLRQAWDRMIFSGYAQGPQVVANEREMLTRVAQTPGAVGYVRTLNSGDKVHVLTVLERK